MKEHDIVEDVDRVSWLYWRVHSCILTLQFVNVGYKVWMGLWLNVFVNTIKVEVFLFLY